MLWFIHVHGETDRFLFITHFIAPPAERQRNFSNAEFSVINFSPKRPQKNCLITIFTFCIGVELPQEGTNVLYKYGFGWIFLKLFDNFFYLCIKVIFQGLKGQKQIKFGYLLLYGYFLKNGLITFLYFWLTASWGWYWSTVKRWIWLNYMNGNFYGQKGQVWPILPHLLILFKFIASCSFFVVKPILS